MKKFKKVPNVYMFSKFVREDGMYSIESEDIKTARGLYKNVFVVYDSEGKQVEVFNRLKVLKKNIATFN